MFSNIILRKKKSVLFNVNNKTTLNHSQLLCKPVFFLCWGVPWHQDRFPITNTQKESRRAGQWVEGIRLSTYDNFTRCERHQYPRFTDEKTEAQSQVSNLPEITKLKDVKTMTQVGSDSNTSTGQPTGLFIPTPVCPHLFCSPTSTAKAERTVIRDNERRLTPTSATSSHCLPGWDLPVKDTFRVWSGFEGQRTSFKRYFLKPSFHVWVPLPL